MRCERNFTVLLSPSFSHTRLREIVIIIIYNTIKTIWPIFKKLTQCVETNLVLHCRPDDWPDLQGWNRDDPREQSTVMTFNLFSFFFSSFLLWLMEVIFQSPTGHTTHQIILNKSSNKKNTKCTITVDFVCFVLWFNLTIFDFANYTEIILKNY